jgi:3-dehydroquinate synthase
MRLLVSLGPRAYPIVLTAALPGAALGALAREVLSPRAARLLIVTDANVAPHYLAGVEAGLAAEGFATAALVLPPGETSKSMGTIEAILDAAFAHKLARVDAMVALGGGVIGDLTGFAASIYQRGIAVLQVPTTLLAQVDSSVGGKTGVNHARGKNLIGTFWQPRAVLASLATLRTLPAREVRCGLAEAVKHGFLADPGLVTAMEADAEAILALEPAALTPIVAACCRIKAAVVAGDEREDPDAVDGGRAILNFGHTFGHAYERLLGYGAWTHGEAVAVGMVVAARLSERVGGASPGLEAEVTRVLARFGLPHDPWAVGVPGADALEPLIEAARGDKKGDQDGVRFVLLERLGVPRVERLTWAEIALALAPWSAARGLATRDGAP